MMNTTISLSDYQIPIISSFLEADQAKLFIEIKDLKETLKLKEQLFNDNEVTLRDLRLNLKIEHDYSINNFLHIPSSNGDINKRTIINAYKSDNSSWKKVIYILDKENKVLTGRQIIEIMYNLEPELKNVPDSTKKKIEMNIFAILSNNTKSGKLIRFKTENEFEYKYGLINWFNEHGKIKKEYLV